MSRHAEAVALLRAAAAILRKQAANPNPKFWPQTAAEPLADWLEEAAAFAVAVQPHMPAEALLAVARAIVDAGDSR